MIRSVRLRALFTRLAWMVVWFLAARAASAREIWVLRFETPPVCGLTPEAGDSRNCVIWRDQVFMHNSNDHPATFRLLGVSETSQLPDVPHEGTLAPHQSTAFNTSFGIVWTPRGNVPFVASDAPRLWVNRIEVPEGVLVSSRLEYRKAFSFFSNTIFQDPPRGSIPLPVITRLTEAGRPQYHLRTDMGPYDLNAAGKIRSRINVGIYNGGSALASAWIQVRRGCDDALTQVLHATVSANSVVQVGGLTNDPGAGLPNCAVPFYTTYVIVTVDQPSFSYTVSAINDEFPYASVSVSSTGP